MTKKNKKSKKDMKKIIEDYRKREKGFNEVNEEYHRKLGKLYGFPQCCIDQFCEEVKVGIVCGHRREKKYNLPSSFFYELEYVPCDKCVEKMLDELGVDYY